MDKLNEQAILRELLALDLICIEEDVKLSIALFGGASLILHLGDNQFRGTRDIDYRTEYVSSREKFIKIQDLMPGVFEELGGFPEFPDQELYQKNGKEYYEWDGVQFSKIKIFLPSIEMIALSKLMSNREKDLEDLTDTPILNMCDLIKLKELIDDCATYLANTREYNFLEWSEILIARGLKLS